MAELEQKVEKLTQELKFMESLIYSLLHRVSSMAWGSCVDRDGVEFLIKEIKINLPNVYPLRER